MQLLLKLQLLIIQCIWWKYVKFCCFLSSWPNLIHTFSLYACSIKGSIVWFYITMLFIIWLLINQWYYVLPSLFSLCIILSCCPFYKLPKSHMNCFKTAYKCTSKRMSNYIRRNEILYHFFLEIRENNDCWNNVLCFRSKTVFQEIEGDLCRNKTDSNGAKNMWKI